ncbi:uncharacterized protein THITE_41471 [Thermothielavioides terrestris NRRL 8126]|uniref:F-box domain-containing protein n=1 Tax=Thermothielavioides terrestris (strain ATCC 38088 / NRRL 8126) TaxID=578455 RepID=G2QUB1_THETT|nr:uncharacterized protein THITE_41471 [Thermothielavioides terrestris NRRL 8126]AEO62863.1 hypothetical protein THITE_41471 [Thermothielavioides terrestris NRRL 8126]
MSAPLGNGGGRDPLQNLTPQRRLALAQAARANATREEIEARGIRPDVQQILHHMNRTPSHSFKRARLSDSGVRKIYDDNETDDTSGDDDDDDDELARAEREEREEDEFEEQWQAMLAQEGLQDVNMFVVAEFRQIARQRIRMLKQGTAEWRAAASRPPRKPRFDLVASLCTCTELIVEVCKHMRPVDIVRLYSISRDFKHTINKHMRSSIFAWANYMAPTASRIFSSPIYGRWFIPDPAEQLVTRADVELGQPRRGQANLAEFGPVNDVEGEVRMIPGLLWLQMVVNREIRVRDIIASLARRGHRLPEGARVTLTKLWLIMDAATSEARMTLLKDQDFFSNEDLYIAQLFMVKLVLAFNDPVFGPQSSMLMRLMMGQRGLSPLWAMLRGKKYRTRAEIRQLKLRYDVGPDQVRAFNGMALHGVQVYELGTMHFEGWGAGPDHLMRPDELIPLEAVRRQLDLDSCLEEMMIFGHVDFTTGNSLVPSLDEMYMSDDDLPPAQKDWKPLKHELIHSGCGNADMVYSDDDDEDDDDGEGDSADDDYEGDGEEADGDVVMGEENRENRAEQMMMAGMGAGFDVDWDRFLSHPAEYAAALQEAALAAARAEALEGGGDGHGDGTGGQNDDPQQEAEEVNINTLVDGLHGGQHDDDDADDVQDHQVQQPGHGNGNVEDTIDWEKYIADEDIGEDPRTKMLRDWYRPW